MNLPKRHHYVPQVLLKRFVDGDGWLYVFSKSDPEQSVRKSKPCNVFIERHLYSTLERDGARDASQERDFSLLETLVDPIVDKFEACAAARERPKLTANERRIWHFFFAQQFRRVPDFLHRPEIVSGAEAHFQEIIEAFRRDMPDRAADIGEIADESDRFVRNALVSSLGSISNEVMEILEARGITLLRITDERKSFVIGSRPVVQLAFSEGRTLRDSGTEMWLPVSSKLLVGVGQSSHPESMLFLENHAAIRHVNRAIAEQSTHIASLSPTLTRSLAFAR